MERIFTRLNNYVNHNRTMKVDDTQWVQVDDKMSTYFGCKNCKQNTKTYDLQCENCADPNPVCRCADCVYMYTQAGPFVHPRTLSKELEDIKYTENDDKLKPPYCSMKAVGHLLKAFANDPVLSLLQVSTIKDTKTLNTSVTFGYAKAIFENDTKSNKVVILNMGTGTPKFQVYKRNPTGGLTVFLEDKGYDELISPSAVPFPETGEKRMEFVNSNLLWFNKCMSDLKEKLDLGESIESIPVYAVVTGTVRAQYYNAKDDNDKQRQMDDQIEDMLMQMTTRRVKKRGNTSFFLHQENEGKYEFDAVGIVVTAAHDRARVILGVGIGKGSTQMPYVSSVDQKVRVCTINMGMGNGKMANGQNPLKYCWDTTSEKESEHILYDALKEWKGPNGKHGLSLILDIKRQIHKCLKDGLIPVVGLKSGALIYYGKNKELPR